MCNKAVDNYPHALEFVPECCKTQNVHKAVDTYLSRKKIGPECFTTQEMCNNAVNRCFFVFVSIPHRYKTQEICDKAVDYCLAA